MLRLQRGTQKPYIEERQTMQWGKKSGQTIICKALHRKLKVEWHEPH